MQVTTKAAKNRLAFAACGAECFQRGLETRDGASQIALEQPGGTANQLCTGIFARAHQFNRLIKATTQQAMFGVDRHKRHCMGF